jgi:predicted dehydrogenase
VSERAGRAGRGGAAAAPRRVAVIGFGLAGAVFHAPLVAATPGLEVAVVVTSNAERAARAQAEHPAATVTADVEAAWGCDLAVVAAANRAHVPLALAAIEQGVAVVVDKPLAPTAAEAQQVVDAATTAGVPLTVFHNRRWDGDFLTARRLVDEGALGPVTRFESRFERFRPAIKPGWREAGDPREGGGTLLDLGTHLVDQAHVLLGPPARVYAEVLTRRGDARVDDDVFVALEHASGARSHLWASAVAPLHGPRLGVSGLRAGFAVDGLDPQEPQLRDGLRPGDAGFGERPPGRLVGADGAREHAVEAGRYQGFYAALAAGQTPVDAQDGVDVLRVLEAARRSSAAHEVVAL